MRYREQVYFKTSEMREMDDHFGDLYGMISDREIEICHELAQSILNDEALLTITSDICGELDRLDIRMCLASSVVNRSSLLALSQGAKLYKLCRPQMTRDNVLHIKGGRYVLNSR